MGVAQLIAEAKASMDEQRLSVLSKHHSVRVRAEAAGNEYTSKADLTRLSKSRVTLIRREVASNPSISFDDTKHLIDDDDWIVRERYFHNWNLKKTKEERDFPDLD